VKRLLIPFLLLIAGACSFANAGDGEEGETEMPEPVNMETVENFDPDLDYAQVVGVKVTGESGGTWRFDVTVRHNDQGWDHYANRWEVVDPDDSTMYGERVLLHPHDDEQPFTRSQTGIEIPDGVTAVLVRSRCLKHGYSGKAILVDLTTVE